MMKTSKIIFILASLFIFVSIQGCSYDTPVEIKLVNATPDKSEFLLKLITNTTLSKESIKVRIFNKYDASTNYPVVVEQSPSNPEQFMLKTQQLYAGSYRITVDVPYQITLLGFSIAETTNTIIRDFIIHNQLSESCYRFNNKVNDVMGWKVSNVYQGNKEAPTSNPTCPGLFYVDTSWPYPVTQTNPESSGGSIFIPVSSECFPKTSNKLSEKPEWMFSVLSPDIQQRDDWQQLKAINFRVAGKDLSFKVSPEIHFRIGEKLSSTYEQNDSPRSYQVQSNQWQIIDHEFNLPQSALITHIEFHLSGIPELTVGEGVNSIFLDGICPVKSQ